MSDIKNLIKAKSHDPYREFEIVSYLTCFETAHKEFFKFMAEKGYELYKKKDYLRKTISDFAKKLKHDIKDEKKIQKVQPKVNVTDKIINYSDNKNKEVE